VPFQIFREATLVSFVISRNGALRKRKRKIFLQSRHVRELFKDVVIQGEVLGDGKRHITLFSSYPLDKIVALQKGIPLCFPRLVGLGLQQLGFLWQ